MRHNRFAWIERRMQQHQNQAVGLVVFALAAGCLHGGQASAQIQGVPLAALEAAFQERGVDIGEVVVPDGTTPANSAVRIELLRDHLAAGALDVWVAPTASAARAWMQSQAETMSSQGTVARSATLYCDTAAPQRATLAVGSLENIGFAVLLQPSEQDDATSWVGLLQTVISGAPRGAIRTTPWTLPTVPDALEVGHFVLVAHPQGSVAARVIAHGPGYARRSLRGWVVTRLAAGPIEFEIVGVDELLRTVRTGGPRP